MTQEKYIQVLLPLKLDWIPYYSVSQEDTSFSEISIGVKVRVIFSGKEYIGVIWNISDSLPSGIDRSKVKSILRTESGLACVKAEELELWKRIAEYYMCSKGEVFRTVYPALKISREEMELRHRERIEARIQKLKAQAEKARRADTKERYLSEIQTLENNKLSNEPGEFNTACLPEISLSPAQENAYNVIRESFTRGKSVLLKGVTGSGKTEIYTKLASECLAQGKNVLYLVPEIALSRQLEQRLKTYFGDNLKVFHSHESSAKRGQVSSDIANSTKDNPYIVLGTRSSLFLPHHNLGLIVIDEEHDNSYKQDAPAPRYNGRDVALLMAQIQSANVIMGSATPSLEELYNCRAGRHQLVELNERYYGNQSIDVEIIDTIAERKKRGMHGSFSRKLIQHINDSLSAGKQVLILRSRRSYSPAVQCSECGEIAKCPRCNVNLSLHKGSNGDRLICHHCGNSYRFEGKCRHCGGEAHGIGAGTQKIEEEAIKLFPEARIARLDSDITKNPKKESEVIKAFSEGETDILIGTQIISKGFDFEKLKLVAVINADAILAIQDFRADEKTFQLLEQFRGRCGRRDDKGLFVVQTSQPDHPVFRQFTDGSEAGNLYDSLLSERKEFRYPPFYRLIHINIRDKFQDKCERYAEGLCQELYTALGPMCESNLKKEKIADITGPYQPVKSIEDGMNIMTIRLCISRCRELAEAKKRIYATISSFSSKNRYDGHISIDVDPQ